MPAKTPDSGTWKGLEFTARDGRVFYIFSEQSYGTPRYYWARQLYQEDRNDNGGFIYDERQWCSVPFDGSNSKQTVMNRVQRYADETMDLMATLERSLKKIREDEQ